MASLEITCERIFTQEGVWRRLLFGGLLVLSIVGIPVAAGYLFLYGLSRGQGKGPELPEWGNLGKYWRPGWHFLAVFGLWYLIPLFLAFLVGGLLEGLTFGLLWWAGYVATAILGSLAPALCIAALVHYQQGRAWSALWDFTGIIHRIREDAREIIFPSVLWAGLIAIFLPLLPFAFFLGFTLLLAYYVPIFSAMNAEPDSF